MAKTHLSGPLYVGGVEVLTESGQLKVHTDLLDVLDANDNELLEWDYNASAVNNFQIDNAVTGSNPILSAVGGDSDIGIDLTGKGTGAIVLDNGTDPVVLKFMGAAAGFNNEIQDVNGAELLTFYPTASAVNEIGITNSATGVNPKISCEGEADTGITFQNSEGEEILILDSVATSVNEVTIASAAANNDPVISATGGDSSIDLQLSPKGTGLILVGNTGTIAYDGTSATINAQRGLISAITLSAATASVQNVTLLNNKLGAGSYVLATLLESGTNAPTAGLPFIKGVKVGGAGSATIVIGNADSRPAGAALAGSANIVFTVLS